MFVRFSALSRALPWTLLVLPSFMPAAARVVANSPPLITIELPPNPGWFHEGPNLVRIRIRVTDPDGDLVSARLDASPTFECFRPIVSEPSGATQEIVWFLDRAGAGHHDLVVRAWDDFDPQRQVVGRQPLLVLGAHAAQRVSFADVDGDPEEELFLASAFGDASGVNAAGAVALFDRYGIRGAGPRPTLLTGSPPTKGEAVGLREGGMVEWADVTGDGRDDLVARDHEAILVWSAPAAGGLITGATATLRCSDPNSGFISGGTDFQLADVTHDGVLDVIATASLADVGGVVDAGEICVFAGGPGLAGTPAPTATLRIPGALAGDRLGALVDPLSSNLRWWLQGVQIADVTGDGLRDVVAGAASADRGATADVGKAYVWAGGSALAGNPAPIATLDATATKASDKIGSGASEGLFLVDLTGDGILDVLIRGTKVGSSGSLFLWKGGPTLAGTLDATARLRQASAIPDDSLGYVGLADGLHFHDFDGDGVLDLLAGTSAADVAGVKDAGALVYFRGGSGLSGLVFETATLRRATPVSFDRLCGDLGAIQLVDVTGDGALDVVVVASSAAGAAPRSGLIAVWSGAGGFSGAVVASAELQVPGAVTWDQLGNCAQFVSGDSIGALVTDVTGDGIADVVAVAPLADVGGIVDAGCAYVWAGGAALTGGGIVAPTATLSDPAPQTDGMFGYHIDGGFALHASDVTGDRVADVVLAVPGDNSLNPPSRNIASLVVFAGGAALAGAPAPVITATSPQKWDEMGLESSDVVVADVDGDAIADLVAYARQFDPTTLGPQNDGALLLFLGGQLGAIAPRVLASGVGGGGNGNDGLFLPPRDIDGDGRLDLLLLQSEASLLSWNDVGQLLLWRRPKSGYGSSMSHLKGTLPPPSGGPQPGLATDPEIATPGDILGDYCHLGD